MRKFLLIIFFFVLVRAQNIKVDYSHSIGKFSSAIALTFVNENLVVLESDNNQILKFDVSGNLLKSNGGFGWQPAQFDEPTDIDSDLLKLYVADKNNNRIQIFDKDLNFISTISSGDNNELDFEYPNVCKISNSGDLYFLDSENLILYKLNTSSLEITPQININNSIFPFENPGKFDLDFESNIHIIHNQKIYVYDSFGNGLQSFDLDFSPVNISINNDYILINSDSKVYISNLYPEIKFQELISSEVKILQSHIKNSKIYLLHSNKISVYNFEK